MSKDKFINKTNKEFANKCIGCEDDFIGCKNKCMNDYLLDKLYKIKIAEYVGDKNLAMLCLANNNLKDKIRSIETWMHKKIMRKSISSGCCAAGILETLQQLKSKLEAK